LRSGRSILYGSVDYRDVYLIALNFHGVADDTLMTGSRFNLIQEFCGLCVGRSHPWQS
jgi:hypothetical protein